MYYEKRVNGREIYFNRLLINTDIIPQTIINGNNIIMKKYPTTIGDYLDEYGEFPDMAEYKIHGLLCKLHIMGILHGDAHPFNFVYDPETQDIRLIDFGKSYLFTELNSDVFEDISSFWETKVTNIDEAILYENKMYRLSHFSA